MADEIDKANELAEMHLKAALKNAQNVTGNESLTGWCKNNCGMPTHGAYCSKECRRDHELLMRNGRA